MSFICVLKLKNSTQIYLCTLFVYCFLNTVFTSSTSFNNKNIITISSQMPLIPQLLQIEITTNKTLCENSSNLFFTKIKK